MKSITTKFTESFAGVNTGKGFVSFYNSFFPEEEFEGIYIIKGGPGTGKSTFMKRLSDIALKKGYIVEHLLCGSDPTSLDGVIIISDNGKKVGIMDGTPPHPREFRCPGACGDILNFGMFWDSRELRKSRETIVKLAREKTVCFDTVYRYLGATAKIEKHIFEIIKKLYLREKSMAAAQRLVREVGDVGKIYNRQLRGITMNGDVSLKPTTEMISDYIILGEEKLSQMFLQDVKCSVETMGIGAIISYSPIDMDFVDSIYFPNSRVWMHRKNDELEENAKIINMKRFIDKKTAAEYKGRLKFGKKCRESLLTGAIDALSKAKELHFSLEQLYSEYMDFEALNNRSVLWYSEILSRLD